MADALMNVWFTRYSTPNEVVSDIGKEFCNKLSEELYSTLNILHKTTSPYHPECNASAEVFNRTMRQYIHLFFYLRISIGKFIFRPFGSHIIHRFPRPQKRAHFLCYWYGTPDAIF